MKPIWATNDKIILAQDGKGGKVIDEDIDNEESWMNSVIYRFVV